MKRSSVTGLMNYSRRGTERPRYHANDTSGDVLFLDPREIDIRDHRGARDAPRWQREGFELLPHKTNVSDWSDTDHVARIYPEEIRTLLLELSGADEVIITAPAIRRFSETSDLSGRLDNSRPARFIHVDVSETTAHEFARRTCPERKRYSRFVQFNVWRVLSSPPQEVPLALCDGRSVKQSDLIPADAVFDMDGAEVWRMEGLVIGHSPEHEWAYFRDMNRDEALVFVTHDSQPSGAQYVPHSAFDHPDVPLNTAPRESAEIRAIAYWFEQD